MRYFNGALQLEETDLESGGFGLPWGHTRSYEHTAAVYRGGGRGESLNGTNWSVEQVPSIRAQINGNVAAVVGRRVFWFAPGDHGNLKAMFPFTTRLSRDAASREYTMILNDSGTTYRFDKHGRFRAVLNPAGDEMVAQYDDAGRLVLLPLASAVTPGSSASYTYHYSGHGRSGDRITSVHYKVDGVDVRRVRYTYYGAGDARGNAGDLAEVTVEGFDAAGGTWFNIRNTHYRYWKPARANHFSAGLKYMVGPQAYANMVAAGLDPLMAADAQVASYAELYLEYKGLKVSKEVTDGGAYTYTFRYQRSWKYAGRNTWAMKTTETLPGVGADGSHDRNVVYTNTGGQVVLKVFISGDESWCTYYRYNGQGACVLEAQPSAVDGYDESEGGLVTLKEDDGLVQRFEYHDPEGYNTQMSVAKGSAGAPVRTRSMTYVGRSTATGEVRLLASESAYQRTVGQGTGPATTTYAYTWQGGSLQLAGRTTALPVVSTNQNGSGAATQRKEIYDANGNVTWAMDERGFIVHQQFDVATGGLVERIEDVQTSGMGGVPPGWTTPTGGGLNLVTDFRLDLLGRPIRELGPTHTIDLDGTATVLRRARWLVYRDDLDEQWQGMGYQTGPVTLPVDTLINPVTITQMDKAGRTVAQIQAERAGTSGALSAADTFPQTSWSRWTHSSYDAQNHLTSQRVYFLIPASGAGSVGTNYNESLYGYSASDWQNRQVTPGGTITRTVYHPQGWVLQTWVGTNDAGATDNDPSGGGTPGNNMVLVTVNEYDDGLAGEDGNLTQQTLHQDAGTVRVTTYEYDFRDRRVAMTPPVGAMERYTFDNQDRVIQVDRRDPMSGTLVGRNATRYDGQGRAYRTLTSGVDPVTGTVGNVLTSNTWYDPAGNVVKSQPAGARVSEKTVYDGVGRTTAVYTGYHLAATGYPYPVNVSGDTIMQQVETAYDAASNAIARTTRERDHDATGTGALTTAAGAQPQARVSYQGMWPDPLGRMVAVANYGTNGAAAWTRPDVVPTASDTVLVTRTTFDAQGNAFRMTDPQGTVTQSGFDQAGRRTQTLENYVPGGTHPDQNRETDYTYNADSRMATLTARNGATGDQTTRFVYGTTLLNSDVASNDLLVAKIYPADTVSHPDRMTYTYNRLGQVKQSGDGNGTVHLYIYDALGRPLHDAVTTLGSGVNGAVRRISRGYEVRGMLQSVISYDDATVGSGSVVNDVRLTYNDFGQLSADYQAHGGAVDVATTPVVSYAYADGNANTVRRTGMTYPDGRVLSQDYGPAGGMDDALSRLSALSDVDGTTLAVFTYLGLDERVALSYPEPGVHLTLIGTPASDGGDQYVGLDRFGRLVDQRWLDSTLADIERVEYGYNRASNRVWRQNPVATALGAAQDGFYHNDGLYQLAERAQGRLNATKTGLVGTPTAQEDFTYDPIGNWANYQTRASGTVTLDQARTHDVDNEITTLADSAALVGYDHAGNMTTAPKAADWTQASTLTWDAWNRLVGVRQHTVFVTLTVACRYDGLTRRTSKVVELTAGAFSQKRGSEYFYSDQWKVLEQEDVVVQVDQPDRLETRQFVWRGCAEDKLILRDDSVDGGEVDRCYALDDGKNVTAVYDLAVGEVTERYGYSGFGVPVFMSGNFGVIGASDYDWETLFCGYRFDADSGLYQVRYRYLHPQLGRWLSKDPVGERGGINLYAYVGNRPACLADPRGLQAYPDPIHGFNPPAFPRLPISETTDGNWTFKIDPGGPFERPTIYVRYRPTDEDKKCCRVFEIRRYVLLARRRFFGGGFIIDDDDPGNNPQLGYGNIPAQAIPDTPGGLGIFEPSPTLVPQNIDFKWCVVCFKGKCAGTVLHCITRTFHVFLFNGGWL